MTAGSYFNGRVIAEYCKYRSCDLISAFFICQVLPLVGIDHLKDYRRSSTCVGWSRTCLVKASWYWRLKPQRYSRPLYIFLSFQTSTCTQESRRYTDMRRCHCQQHPDWCGSPRSCLHGYLAHRAKRGQHWRRPQLFIILYPAIMTTDATSVRNNHPWLKMEFMISMFPLVCFACLSRRDPWHLLCQTCLESSDIFLAYEV